MCRNEKNLCRYNFYPNPKLMLRLITNCLLNTDGQLIISVTMKVMLQNVLLSFKMSLVWVFMTCETMLRYNTY